MARKKKVSKKVSKKALPKKDALPEGFKKLDNTYAPAWEPEKQKLLHGKVTGGVREVSVNINGTPTDTRCMEVTQKKNGERLTLWESAMLGALFDEIIETGEGPEIYVRFDGYGEAKPNQNPPKLFTIAVKEDNPF